MENLPSKRRNPAASLTDDLIVEILGHLPVRSVCQLRCVCRSWFKLIADHEHRKKLPQTLSGFFYRSFVDDRCPYMAHHFANVSGIGMPLVYPSFSYYLPQCDRVIPFDCCNGLLICRCFQPEPPNGDGSSPFHYAVCNPATEEWVMLPDAKWAIGEVRTAGLAFDPAVSPHFHVPEYVQDNEEFVTGVEIYSSKTGLWSLHGSGWSDDVAVNHWAPASMFLNGFLHSVTLSNEILVVDMEGKNWRTIPMPDPAGDLGIIHQTQGHLCAFHADEFDNFKLSIWILEDYHTDNWILKHAVSSLELFEGIKYHFHLGYRVIAVHPECNLIFFVYGWDNTLMAYDMDRKEVRVVRNLGNETCEPYLPYVPLFSGSLAGGH